MDATFEDLVEEAERAPIEGWDFSWLAGARHRGAADVAVLRSSRRTGVGRLGAGRATSRRRRDDRQPPTGALALKVVFHDGVNIHTVTHLGRYIPAELRTALELGDPPEFDGITCSGCGKRFKLQWDHLDPVCAGGVTSYANEDPKCWECHAKKCDEERAAGLYDKPPATPTFADPVSANGRNW